MEITENLIYLWLALADIKPTKQNKVLQKYSLLEFYERVGVDSQLENIFSAEYGRLVKYKDKNFLENSLDKMFIKGINYITITDEGYPAKLRDGITNPPNVLFYKGDKSLFNTVSASMVGTRHCSLYGKDAAKKLAEGLCEYGITIVSGMAVGIDYFSHEAALDANGKTIAVLGSGVNNPTPKSNYALYRRICENGLVVSEYSPESDASKYTFPERNRIISGLSDVCIVVEAAIKSGSLITADFALEQGREVFAVPGNITSPKSQGTNMLLKEKARPVTCAKDILVHLNCNKLNNDVVMPKKVLPLDIYEQQLYNLLEQENLTIDQIKEKSDFSIKEILEILFSLELKGAIKRVSSNTYQLERSI